MPKKASQRWNEYDCCIEMNQNGKYCARIQAHFKRHGWILPVYFLASTSEPAIRKLEQTVQFLQQNEERLWLCGVDRTGDPHVSAEMLCEAGLHLDRRAEFPQRTERLTVAPEQRVPAFLLEPVRRGLAQSIRSSRTLGRAVRVHRHTRRHTRQRASSAGQRNLTFRAR